MVITCFQLLSINMERWKQIDKLTIGEEKNLALIK